jgi:hypothetical protein
MVEHTLIRRALQAILSLLHRPETFFILTCNHSLQLRPHALDGLSPATDSKTAPKNIKSVRSQIVRIRETIKTSAGFQV